MTTTTVDPEAIHAVCPSWCVTPPERHSWGTRCSDDHPVVGHDGPEFGRYITTGATATFEGLGPIEVRVCDLDDVDLTADALRQLAADAQAAARWLEEQQKRA
jgi:hypothetical protein